MVPRWLPLLFAAGFLGVWAVMAFVPPESIRTPGCQMKEWTGINCPGCGGTRAARHLSKGEFFDAARDNILIYPLTVMALWGMVAFAANTWCGKRWWTPERITLWMATCFGVIVLVYTVVRNTEWGWFLRP